MNEIRKHEELKHAYENDLPLQSVKNIIGRINFLKIIKHIIFFRQITTI